MMAQVVKRPSASVRTPYVADVQLLEPSTQPVPPRSGGGGTGNAAAEASGSGSTKAAMVLAHTPALDCAGMIVPGCRVHMSANVPKADGKPQTKTTHAVRVRGCTGCVTAAVGGGRTGGRPWARVAIPTRSCHPFCGSQRSGGGTCCLSHCSTHSRGTVTSYPGHLLEAPSIGNVTRGCTCAPCPALHGPLTRRPSTPVLVPWRIIDATSCRAVSWQVCEDLREGGTIALVGSHPALAEDFARTALAQRLIPELGAYEEILGQQTVPGSSSRVDFVLVGADGARTLLEVKCVVCADYPEGAVPEGRHKVRGVGQGRGDQRAPLCLVRHAVRRRWARDWLRQGAGGGCQQS